MHSSIYETNKAKYTYYFWFKDTKEGLYKLQDVRKCKNLRGAKQTLDYKLIKHLFENCPYVTAFGISDFEGSFEVQMAKHKVKF